VTYRELRPEHGKHALRNQANRGPEGEPLAEAGAASILNFRVEEEWSPGEMVVDRSAIKTFGSRSEPRQSGPTTLILSLDKA
ncbi:MAG: hypothetical protein QGF59_25725, partial [Pirellulaceae bacterium]|nr:hypothetical protein [Pirellulaceae bacterium]